MSSTTRARTSAPLLVRGRNRELAILEVVVREVRPAVVRGRPGAGVSTMLDEAARRAATEGVRVGRLRPRPWAGSALELVDDLEPMLAGRDKVLVVLDDADLCDPAQRAEVVRRSHRSRAPLLAGAHSAVPEVSGANECTLVELGFLERAGVADLVGDALGEQLTRAPRGWSRPTTAPAPATPRCCGRSSTTPSCVPSSPPRARPPTPPTTPPGWLAP